MKICIWDLANAPMLDSVYRPTKMYSETAKSIKNWINRCLLEVPSLQYKGVIALRLRSIYCITIHMPVLEYIFYC